MLGIKSISYESKNSAFYINISEKTVSYINIKKEISEKTIFNYLEHLFRIIDTWQEKYPSSNIVGQDSWQLLINYTDGKIKKFSGHSNFPSNFEAFERLNQDLIKEKI